MNEQQATDASRGRERLSIPARISRKNLLIASSLPLLQCWVRIDTRYYELLRGRYAVPVYALQSMGGVPTAANYLGSVVYTILVRSLFSHFGVVGYRNVCRR